MNPTAKILGRLTVSLLLLITAAASHAEMEHFTRFGDYKVVHTVFNSSFLQPEIAAAYNLTRGKGQALVNVALIKSTAEGDSNGLPARVTGSVANLMQQQRTLEFQEIQEQEATYYLAPFRHTSEEVLHFTLTVEHEGQSFEVKFHRKLYMD